MEEEEDTCIKNVDKCNGMAGRSRDIIANVMINKKKISNDESKVSDKYLNSAAPNHDINLFEIFWDNIGGNSNQAGLEMENAEENDIERFDDLEAEVFWLLSDTRNGDDESADIWCSNGTYDVGYCDRRELTGDEVGVDKEISLIDFDESNQIDEREPKSMFDAFIKQDLIDFW
ncbi:6856_t:CDS:2, partial [Racocetra persica]